MKTFLLPDLGEGLHEAVITEWFASPGSVLAEGASVLSVETAKAVVDIPAPCPLRLAQCLPGVGDTVRVGDVLFRYDSPARPVAPVVGDAGSVVGSLAPPPDENGEDRVFLPGSLRYPSSTLPPPASRPPAKPPGIPATEAPGPVPDMRHWMHLHMTEAHREVARVTVFEEVRWRRRRQPLLPRLVQALCSAARTVPEANAWLVDGRLQPQEDLHVGIAVDTAHGLLVPVIHHPDRLSSGDLEASLMELVERARQGRLGPGEGRGATLTLTSYGGLGGLHATPMVMPPQVVILGAGRAEARLEPSRSGKPRRKVYLPLSLSFDHRALSGGEAIRFLKAFIHAFEAESGAKKNRR